LPWGLAAAGRGIAGVRDSGGVIGRQERVPQDLTKWGGVAPGGGVGVGGCVGFLRWGCVLFGEVSWVVVVERVSPLEYPNTPP